MNSEIIKKENNEIQLKLVVAAEQFEKAVDGAYKKLKGKFNISGFRKGKAPKKIIMAHYGEEVFYEEAINICFPEVYEKALETHNIDPVDRPEIDIDDIVKGKDVVFTATIQVMPEVKIENYKGIRVEKKEYNVQEEDIDREIKSMQDKNGRMVLVEDRPVKENDMVIIDYKGSVDGDYFDGGTAEKQPLTIGSGQFIPGFEEQIIGAKIGDEIEVKVTFPTDYQSEDLAGKDAIFEVKLHEIKEQELPVLDDEFVKDVSEFDTVEEFKNDIREKLEIQAKNKGEQETKNNVIKAVVAMLDIELPKAVVDRKIDTMIKEFDFQLSQQGMNLETFYQMSGSSEENIRKQMEDDANERVKTELALEKVCELEKIEVSDEELEVEVERMANIYKQELDKFKSSLGDNEYNYIKQDVKNRKTIEFLVENANFS
ncbi:MAG: trigger factor [Clostridiales bacterium]|nr:trigger factor [Clostridiales bacterium]